MNLNCKGKSNPNYKHGLKHHKLYGIWLAIKKRCYCENFAQYQNYGGRGIKVCRKWRNNPKIFYNWAITHGWKEGLTIDRINNDLGYRPSNCRFVTRIINNKNKGTYKNNTSGYKGVVFHKASNKYTAQPIIKGKRKYLGLFNTAEEAAEAIENYK